MARALTEVVFQVRVAPGRLAKLLAESPRGRIVLTPVARRQGPYPDRFIATAARLDAKRPAILDALGLLLVDPTPIGEEDQVLHVLGDLRPELQRTIDGTLGEALAVLGPDLIHRPILLKEQWANFAIITARAGPVEDAIQRLAHMLKEQGHPARLTRYGPYHPESQTLGTYEETLTPKQAEILRVALALGLYDTPRRCTLDDLADIFGISKAAAHNRMKGAERKIIAQYFD